MNIFIVNGSARNDGTCKFIADKLKSTIIEINKEANISVFTLAESKILPCEGCVACCADKNKHCFLDDDIKHIYEQMEKADVLVYLSPIYDCFISGSMKNFIDRTNYYTSFFKLAGKPMNLILCGVQPLVGETKEFSNKHVVKTIKDYFLNYSYINHTKFNFLKFFQVQTHHSINIITENLDKDFNKIAKTLIKQKIDLEIVKASQYEYRV